MERDIIDYTSGFWLDDEELLEDVIGGVFDGDLYGNIVFSATCDYCSSYLGYVGCAPVCKVYAKGIPPDLWREENPCPEFCKIVELPKPKRRGKL